MKVAKSHLAMENAIPAVKILTSYKTRLENYPVERLHVRNKCMLILLPKNIDQSDSVVHLTLFHQLIHVLQLYQHHSKLERMFNGLRAVSNGYDIHRPKSHFYLMHFEQF